MSKSYLVARAGGLHFRLCIPADLQHLFRRLELRRSLSCLRRRHARLEAQRLACLSLDFFERLRAMSESYTVRQLEEIADRWLNERIRDTVREYRAARRSGAQLPGTVPGPTVPALAEKGVYLAPESAFYRILR